MYGNNIKNIINQQCKVYRMLVIKLCWYLAEGKKILSYGNVKYSLLIFDCSDWNKNYENELKYIWRKDLRTHTDFVMVALINFVWYWEKGSIHMSACWRGINSMKHHYWKTKNSTITWQKKILQMLIMNPQRKYEKTFKWKI